MILCFSGTGNSRYVADALAEDLGDQVLDLAPYVKELVAEWGAYPTQYKSFERDVMGKGTGPVFETQVGKPFVLVCPIYGWRVPEAVEGVLATARFIGSEELYVVATFGEETAAADAYCERLASRAHMMFKGFTGIRMPSTYSKLRKMPDKATARSIRLAARADVTDAAKRIQKGLYLHKKDKTRMAGVKSGAMHHSFRLYEAGSKHFVVSDTCSKCGRCELFCPVGDITLTPEGVQFGDNCISCYACIHRCPDSSIDVRGQSEANGRYTCPSYREEMEDLEYERKKAERKAAREVAAAVKAPAAAPTANASTSEPAAEASAAPKKMGRLAAKRAAMQAAEQAAKQDADSGSNE